MVLQSRRRNLNQLWLFNAFLIKLLGLHRLVGIDLRIHAWNVTFTMCLKQVERFDFAITGRRSHLLRFTSLSFVFGWSLPCLGGAFHVSEELLSQGADLAFTIAGVRLR